MINTVSTCSRDHAPITFEDFHCPLCAEMADRAEVEDGIWKRDDQLEALKSEIDDLKIMDFDELRADAALANRYERMLRSIGQDMSTIRRYPNETKAKIFSHCASIETVIYDLLHPNLEKVSA